MVTRLSKEFDNKAPTLRTPEMRLVGASTEWLIAPGDRRVDVHVVVSESTCRVAGLLDSTAGEIDAAAIKGAERRLATVFRGALRALDGYAVNVEVGTLRAWVDDRPSCQHRPPPPPPR